MKNARIVLLAAAGMGLVSDFLFHDSLFESVPWGLNLFVWLLALTVASLTLTCRTKPTSQWKSLWFLVPPLFLAAGCAWRDSAVLRWLDVGMLFAYLFVFSMSISGFRMVPAGVGQYLMTAFMALDSLIARPISLLFNDAGWKDMLDERSRKHVSAVLRGLLIALPILTIFAALFVSADAAFAELLKRSFQCNPGKTIQHIVLVLGSVWCVGGYLHGMFGSANPHDESQLLEPNSSIRLKLGLLEAGVVLALIDLLFLSFVLVQAQYFFGGSSLVEVTAGMTYSEYARRGFFELVTVASLVLPILLFLDWIVEKTSAAGLVLIRSLTGVQLALLSVIMISAVQRMNLYQLEYGMTELRFYTTAFMVWLAIVCLIFGATVLRGRRETFAFCSFLSGFLVVVGLHAINPDALIVRTNIERAREGKTFDLSYALQLSNDAIPDLVAGIQHLKPLEQGEIVARLNGGLIRAWKSDWRSWNWSGSEAVRVVKQLVSKEAPGENGPISKQQQPAAPTNTDAAATHATAGVPNPRL